MLTYHLVQNSFVHSTGVKELRVYVIQCPPQYKIKGCHEINSMTLIRVYDMYHVHDVQCICAKLNRHPGHFSRDIPSLRPFKTFPFLNLCVSMNDLGYVALKLAQF